MIKFFRLTLAAAMMAGLMSAASGAKAQSTGGVSLLDPTTAPIVGGLVETLVADSGLTGNLFTVVNADNLTIVTGLLGLDLGGDGSPGLLSIIPGGGVLEPIAFPLFSLIGSNTPLLDPTALGGLGAPSAGDGGSPLAALGGLPLVGDLTGVLGLAGGGADPAASGAGLPVVGAVLAPVLGVVGGLLGGGKDGEGGGAAARCTRRGKPRPNMDQTEKSGASWRRFLFESRPFPGVHLELRSRLA